MKHKILMLWSHNYKVVNHIQLFFLIEHLYLNGVWLVVTPKIYTKKCAKKWLDHMFK